MSGARGGSERATIGAPERRRCAVIIDCAHYRDGRRQRAEPMTVTEAGEICARDEGFVWLGMFEPSPEEITAVQERFGLHDLAVEDAQKFHLRPKIERYDDFTFVVLRTARYVDETEEVEFGEISVFLGHAFAITVRHGAASDLHKARLRAEQRPELLREGAMSVLWAVLDQIVDDYVPVVEGLELDIEEVEATVFSGEVAPTERVYHLRREATDFYRAVHPLLGPLDGLERGVYPGTGHELRQFFRDVNDHLKLVNEEVAAQRDLLTTVLEANMAVITVQQNEVVRAISGWAAVIAVPTFIASIYGMNFRNMPELSWGIGYPGVLVVMLAIALGLYVYLKRVRWL
jgi:magnesium transporter